MTAPPRLVHLADYGGIYRGSFIPMLLAISSAAQNRGWSVELVFSEVSQGRSWLADIERAGIPYRFLEVGSRTGLGRWASWMAAEATWGQWRGRMMKAVAALAAESRSPTILHTHFSAFDVAAAHAARKEPRACVIWHGHSMRRPGWKATAGGILTYRVFARNVSEFLCVSPDVMQKITQLAPRKCVRFFPNAIDAELFAPPTAEERSRARAKLGIAGDVPVLLHFGWQWFRKGGDLYLAAVSLLSAGSGRNLRPITVGEEARAAVEDAAMGSEVSVLPATEDVRELYAAADVFLSPSRSEGMPFAVLEALAMGLPVIASDIPGHAFVGNAVRACRLTNLTPDDIAAAVHDVLNQNAEERLREQTSARRWILEQMDLKNWAERLVQIYDMLFRRLAT
jgi:glycosyltransferase involved in cell wall biosynthesis